ncbi:MAG: Tetratricopeptide 1 repeat-containing protein [Bacteroidetes bacterium]|nr:Tetratricopeptide 1 repeat-containing protein [Bacteroidota bacterium]
MTKNNKIIRIFIVIILVAAPIAYLFYKTSGVPPLPKEEAAAVNTQAADLPALENLVRTNPTFDNLINLSTAYINNKMPGKSIDHLKRAIGLNPSGAIAYNDLGVAYTMMQQYGEGVDNCTKALQLDSTFQLAKNNLKWANDEKKKVLEVIRLQEQIPENKRNIAFYSDYGFNYFKTGDYTKSIDIWNKIFELDVKNTGALNSIGTAFMMKNQVEDAIVLFKKAIELEPGNQLAKNNLAWALSTKH